MLSRRTTLKAAAGLAAVFAGLMPVQASNLLRGRITQGALLRGRTDPQASVTLDGKPVRVSPEGHFAFGLAWDRSEAGLLSILRGRRAGGQRPHPGGTPRNRRSEWG
jgi:hypothetical protein